MNAYNNAPMAIAEHTRFEWANRSGEIITASPRTVVVAFDDDPDAQKAFNPSEVHLALSSGSMNISPPENKVLVFDHGLTSRQLEEVEEWDKYLKALDEEPFPGSESTRKRVIKDISEDIGDNRRLQLKAATFRRQHKKWIDKYDRNTLALYLGHKQRRPKRFTEVIENLVFDVIDEKYLNKENLSGAEVYRHLEDLHKNSGIKDKLLSESTFYERLAELDPLEIELARKGRDAAKKLANTSSTMYWADFPLQYVETDAVHLQLGIIDPDTNEFLGTLIVYVAIDRCTRCILGYSTSIKGKNKGETAEGYIEALKHAQLPKPHMPHTDNPWFAFGNMNKLILDPSAAGISQSIKAFTAYCGITRVVTEASLPKRKPFIERFFGTFRSQCVVHIPGARCSGQVNLATV